jgi:hypothetical protein
MVQMIKEGRDEKMEGKRILRHQNHVGRDWSASADAFFRT